MFPLLFFQDMVETCYFQRILGQVFEAFVQWMVWHSFHLFSVCEKLTVPSRVKGLHFSVGVLFIAPSMVLSVGLGCCSTRTCTRTYSRWCCLVAQVCCFTFTFNTTRKSFCIDSDNTELHFFFISIFMCNFVCLASTVVCFSC